MTENRYFDFEDAPLEEFDSAKVMVWESFGNMKPVCEFENVVR